MYGPISLNPFENFQKHFNPVLKNDFPYGYRIGSMIDKNRFKNCYKRHFGSELEHSDQEITDILCEWGTRREDRIFSRDIAADEDKLMKMIINDISGMFDAGVNCIYFSELYKKYYTLALQCKFFSLEAFSEELSKVLSLDELGGRYRVSKSCIYKGSENGAYEEIYNVLRSSCEPISREEIQKKLWHIPPEIIKNYLKTAKPKEFVNVADETYFYAPNLPFAPDDLEEIKCIINIQLEHKSFITINELRGLIDRYMPYSAMDIEGFTTRVLSRCLAFLLKKDFSFSGPIISKIASPLSMNELFEDFCSSRDEFTMDELDDFATEVNHSHIRWKSVLDVAVRVSKDKFVRNGLVNFDIPKIDNAIDQVLNDRVYMPLKDMKVFLHYADVGYSWNQYLLESYVEKYSWNFMIVRACRLGNGHNGAVVRRNCGIKDFQELITDFLAGSDLWQTREQALALLVNEGFLQTKKCSCIDAVISDVQSRKGRDLLN